jgi:anti-sigma B factor antagonist
VELTISPKDGYSLVHLNGRLDILTFQQVGDQFNEVIAEGHKRLLLDASDLSYVSSAGLRVILQARKAVKAGGGIIVIANANDFVLDVMNTTGFTSIIPTFPTLEEAESAVKG